MDPIDGWYSLDNPIMSLLSTGPGVHTAGPAGAICQYFAWADPVTGEVSNLQIAGGPMGLVLFDAWLYDRNGWNYAFEDANGNLTLRAGMMVVLAIQGNFSIRFPLGAQAGARVYASTTTGAPAVGMSGIAGYVATPFTAMSNAGPQGMAYISSFQQSIS